MTSLLEIEVSKLSTLKENCVNDNGHDLRPFVYDGEPSDFESICINSGCGGLLFNSKGIYTFRGLEDYKNSDKYETLLAESREIEKSVEELTL